MTATTARKPTTKQLINNLNRALEQVKAQPTKLVVMIKAGNIYLQISKAYYAVPGDIYKEVSGYIFHPMYFAGLGYNEKIEDELKPFNNLDELSKADARTTAIRFIEHFKPQRVYTAEL
jgi:hypothetical protein